MALTTLTTPSPRLKEGKKKEARDPVSCREGTAWWELLLLAGRQLMVTLQGRNQGNKYPDLSLLPPLDFLRYPIQPGARGQGRQLGPHRSQPPRVEGGAEWTWGGKGFQHPRHPAQEQQDLPLFMSLLTSGTLRISREKDLL